MHAFTLCRSVVAAVLIALVLAGCAGLPPFSASGEIVVDRDDNLADRAIEYVRELCAEGDPELRLAFLRELNQAVEPNALVVICFDETLPEAPDG